MTFPHAEKVTEHLGVAKFGPNWYVVDMADKVQIGPFFSSKVAAITYAFHRQETTYA